MLAEKHAITSSAKLKLDEFDAKHDIRQKIRDAKETGDPDAASVSSLTAAASVRIDAIVDKALANPSVAAGYVAAKGTVAKVKSNIAELEEETKTIIKEKRVRVVHLPRALTVDRGCLQLRAPLSIRLRMWGSLQPPRPSRTWRTEQ